MGRFFNTAGPIKKDIHYYIEPLKRVNLAEIERLIQQQKYFVLHAPRQTGKTSYLLALMEHLNKKGEYTVLYSNIEAAQAARENVKEGIETILSIISGDARDYLGDSFLQERWKEIFQANGAFSALGEALNAWSKHNRKPVVLLLDEVDSLVGDTLISLLRQLRGGYNKRPLLFPQSIVLCGVRDVRDYRIHSSKEKEIITGGSAFNIKAESLRLENFAQDEIETLYGMHAVETGQCFEREVFPLVWELTEGQPWLVNALAYEACFKIDEGTKRDSAITADIIMQAKENLVLRRETHLDQLVDKLKEERVRRVLEPILSGAIVTEKILEDDVEYVSDLGLIQASPQLRISNQIYREIIPRALTYATQVTLNQDSQWYIDANGRLDVDKLLTAFQDFFRKHFESWVEGFDYNEAGPQLLLQAFLQRVVNGGGQVEREYGLGRQRTDLLLIWPFKDGMQEVVIELKLRYGTTAKTIEAGLKQTLDYMDKCGTGEGYLVIFDRRKRIPWKEKIFKKTRTVEKTKITVYGM